MYQKLKNIYHLFVAITANIFYQFPARKIKVIGVTGTDGKTTTVSIINHILNESGLNTSMLTSIGVEIGDKKIDTGFHVTTPSPFALQRIIKKAVLNNSDYFILEVTSHSIDQNRIHGIPFEVSVITNVSSEHLDYHKNYEEYVGTKEKLLLRSKTAIINKDDKSYKYLSNLKDHKNTITYGLEADSKINLKDINSDFIRSLPEFNQYNFLAAFSVCKSLGIDEKGIIKALTTFKMPEGRYEFVYKKEFAVVMDFAHTPNSFEKVLSSLRGQARGRLIHVFGSAGERDIDKRSLMGEVSSRFSDIIVLTAEDPRKENIDKIIEDIAKGIKKGKIIKKIPDRKAAINEAINIAKKGDVVVITGKGHEKSMTYGRKDFPWDERKAIEDAVKLKNGKN